MDILHNKCFDVEKKIIQASREILLLLLFYKFKCTLTFSCIGIVRQTYEVYKHTKKQF